MMDLANMFALVQEGSQGSQGILSGAVEYLNQLGLGTGELSAGGAAAGLAVVWVVARVVRTIVSILFALCVLLLLLQLAGVVELSSVWEVVQGWFSSAPQNQPA